MLSTGYGVADAVSEGDEVCVAGDPVWEEVGVRDAVPVLLRVSAAVVDLLGDTAATKLASIAMQIATRRALLCILQQDRSERGQKDLQFA